MGSSNTALVKYDWENAQQLSNTRWLDDDVRQDFRNSFRFTTTLINILYIAILLIIFSFIYNWIHHKFQGGEKYVVSKSDTKVRSAPHISEATKRGVIQPGILVRVINKREEGKRTWFEVEFISPQPEFSDSKIQKWIAAENLTFIQE